MKKTNNEALRLAKYIHDWICIYAPSIRSNSCHTIKTYTVALTLFIGFLEKEKRIVPSSLSAECFSKGCIEEWILWLKNTRNCCKETCNVRIAALRAFLKYLAGQDITYLSVYQNATLIPRQKTVRKKITGISKNAVKTIMSMPDVLTKTGRRDLVLLIVLYCTAARIDEILSMKISQLHLDVHKPYVTVVGKGSKIRTLYLLPKAVAHLKKYLQDFHAAKPQPEAYVFYSRNKGLLGKMSAEGVNKQLRKYAAAAHDICNEVPVDLHAHQIRHAKASHWLEDGMNIVQISFLLGYSNLQTTMVYLDVTTEQESKALATLEDENKNTISKKWKYSSNSLAAFLGVREMENR